MQLLISIFFGMLCAMALKKSNETSGLGHWRFAAGALAGAFPHVDSVIFFFSSSYMMAYQNGFFWSILFMPIYANIVAYILAVISGKTWKLFVPVTLGVMFLSLILAALTHEGVQLFAPFSNKFVALNLIYPFDLTIMAISLLMIITAFLLPRFKMELGRLGLILVLCYVFALVTFHFKARAFANSYAQAFSLEVERIHVIPQPISSFNWRLVVETKDQRYHDTMVNLFRDEEVELDGEDSRTNRIDSLYKPMDKAVWRVYRRYGHKDQAFSKSAWLSMYKASDQFKRLSRYWVAKDVIQYNSNTCARFVDLRREGSRRLNDGMFMICRENNGAALYRSNSNDRYSLLEMMY